MPLSSQIDSPPHRPFTPLAAAPERFLWAVRVRWLVIAGFWLLALLAYASGELATIVPCVYAAAAGVLLNAINHASVRQRRHMNIVTAIAIPCDHILITYVVVNSGGVQSPFMMMYVVEVLATAMLVGTRVATVSAGLALCLWLLGITLFMPVPAGPIGADTLVAHRGMWAAFLFYCLALLVYLGGYVSERLRRSERDLAEKNLRLEDALASLQSAHAELSSAHDRLKRTEAHLIHSEKMRSLGELVAGVAHELTNPITFVSGNVEHLRRYVAALAEYVQMSASLPLAADARACVDAHRRTLGIDEALSELPTLLDDCEEGARRTKHIVNDLRLFSRTDRQEAWEQFDVHRGIDSTLALLSNRLKDHITVHRDFGDLPEVECLSGALNQVFMNLFANAADAVGGRPGNLWISTRLTQADLPARPAAAAVRIAVRDDGVGISPDLQGKIFDPFFTTKTPGQGTGLGLSVSYGIIARHGGTLTVASSPGDGATFTITVPVHHSPASPLGTSG